MNPQTLPSPVSTPETEPKLERSEEEFQNLVLEQMPQLKYIARRIHEHLPQHVPFEDLVNAGIVGLIDALNKFDSEKNVKICFVCEVSDSRGNSRQPARNGLESARPAQKVTADR